jgi:hypothetical protein
MSGKPTLHPNEGSKPKLLPNNGPEAFKDKIIGKSIDLIPTSKLPVRRLVLQRARALRAESTKNKELSSPGDISDKAIAKVIAHEIQLIWQRAAIPCRRVDKVQELVLKSMNDVSVLMKHWSRYTENKDPLQSFIISLDKLFDVSSTGLHHMLLTSGNPEWQQDWKFYQEQSQVPQVGSMCGRDKLLEERCKRLQKRDAQHNARIDKEAKMLKKKADEVIGASQEAGDEYEDEDEDAKTPNYTPPLRYERQKHKKPDRIPLPEGVSRRDLLRSTTDAATRWGLSSAAHLSMVASTVNAAGGNMEDVVASLPTAKRHRKSAQEEMAGGIKEEFKLKFKEQKKVVHWDGKITQFLDAQGLVYQDCNAVVLSVPLSGIKPQFIGAPVVQQGTGQLLAEVTLHCLDEWDARNAIIGIGFDTTSANTGIQEGAAVHIESEIEHSLLWLACRHHMAELHVKHPYNKVQGPTKGPDDPLFKRFKAWYVKRVQEARLNDARFPDPGLFSKWQWEDISATGPYQSDLTWWERATLTWVQDQLHANTFPRGDYRELCELINIILGGEVIIRIRIGLNFITTVS